MIPFRCLCSLKKYETAVLSSPAPTPTTTVFYSEGVSLSDSNNVLLGSSSSVFRDVILLSCQFLTWYMLINVSI